MAESVLKRITGEDKISARFLYSEFQEFTPKFKILLDTNHRPRFRGQDNGLWRRVRLITFSRTFGPNERDHLLRGKLRDEAEGILAWAVRGAQAFYASGSGQVTPTAIMEAEQLEYRSSMDVLGGFLPGILEADPAGKLPDKEVIRLYTEWNFEHDPGGRTMSAKGLREALRGRGIESFRGTGGATVWTLRLATKPTIDEEAAGLVDAADGFPGIFGAR